MAAELALAEEAGAYLVVYGQVWTAEEMVRDARWIFRDKRHGLLTNGGCRGRRILKESAKPSFDGVAAMKISAVLLSVAISRDGPIGVAA